MKKHTTILSAVAAIIIALAVFFIYMGMRHSSVLDNTTVKIDSSDAAVKVFLEEMIPHHQEAVDTSRFVMNDKDITNPQIRLLAGRIADKQEFEISQMKSWYYDWFGIEYTASSTLLKTPYEPMMGDMTKLKGDNLARAYLQNMIIHHEHAVMTASEVRMFIESAEKKNGVSDGQISIVNSHPGIDQTLIFTKQIETDQTKEIEEMKGLEETI